MTDETNIIGFPDPRADKSYWSCGCGCMTHYLIETGQVECASCGQVADPRDGFYLHKPNGIIREMGDTPVMPFTITDDGGEFSRHRWAERVRAKEFVTLIGIRKDGLVSTACFEDDALETPEQKSWLRERIRDAYKLLVRAP